MAALCYNQHLFPPNRSRNMMRLPRLNTARLRTAGLLLFAAVLSFGGIYSLFYSLSSPEQLDKLATSFTDGRRTVTFDRRQISRRLFPRPTLTLRNLSISRPDSTQSDIRIEEMRIGISWKSLLGQTEIEKWVFVRPRIRLETDENGRFNLEDLLKTQHSVPANRIYIEQAEVSVQTPEYRLILPNAGLTLRQLSSGNTHLTAGGKLSAGTGSQTEWRTSAILSRHDQEWTLSDFQAEIGGEWGRHPFGLTANGRLSFHNRTGQWQIKPLHAHLSLPLYETHIQASVPNGHIRNGSLNIAELSALLSSSYRQAQWDGTLSLTRLHIRPTAADIGKLAFSGSRKDGSTNLYATLSGPFVWQHKQGWHMDNLNFGSRLENTLGKRNIRFHSELSGRFSYAADGSWQSRLSGLFDRHSLTLEADYTPAAASPENRPGTAVLNSKIDFAVLKLDPYLDEEPGSRPFDSSTAALSDSLKQGRLQLNSLFSARSLQWGSLEMNDLKTRIKTDGGLVLLPDFRSKLYGGSTYGSITIGLTDPYSYHIRQTAENVQIRPLLQDIFRYGSISGQGRAVFDLQSKGSSRTEWLENTKGSVELNLYNGALWGLDLHNIFAQEYASPQTERFTPFKRFIVTSEIADGIGRHREAKLFSDTLNVVSQGEIDFNTMTLNEKTNIFPQNGKGRPVPIDIRGPIDNPSVTVDYSSLTAGLPDPAAKHNALTETLKEQWLWLKPKTPARIPADTGKTP